MGDAASPSHFVVSLVFVLLAVSVFSGEVNGYRQNASHELPLDGVVTFSRSGDRYFLSERNVFVEDDVPEQPQDSLLTQRNMEVLKWLAQGKSREETAVILGISLETVKTHAKSILQKLDVQNTAGAITRAFELGLLRA